MVYKCQSATYGDIRQDCRTPRSRYKRTVEDREKQVIVLKGRWCIPLSGKTVRKASMDKIESKMASYFEEVNKKKQSDSAFTDKRDKKEGRER